jgi:hypothetical protein
MHIQGLSEKLGGPGQIFVLAALFFSKMLASGGKEVKFVFRSFKKGSKKFSGRTSVKLRFKKIVSGQIPVPTLLKLSPAVIYIKKRSKLFFLNVANLGPPLNWGPGANCPQCPSL